MCMLCVEQNLSGLNWREIKSNGLELTSAAKDVEELVHIIDRLKEIYAEKNPDQNSEKLKTENENESDLK